MSKVYVVRNYELGSMDLDDAVDGIFSTVEKAVDSIFASYDPEDSDDIEYIDEFIHVEAWELDDIYNGYIETIDITPYVKAAMNNAE